MPLSLRLSERGTAFIESHGVEGGLPKDLIRFKEMSTTPVATPQDRRVPTRPIHAWIEPAWIEPASHPYIDVLKIDVVSQGRGASEGRGVRGEWGVGGVGGGGGSPVGRCWWWAYVRDASAQPWWAGRRASLTLAAHTAHTAHRTHRTSHAPHLTPHMTTVSRRVWT